MVFDFKSLEDAVEAVSRNLQNRPDYLQIKFSNARKNIFTGPEASSVFEHFSTLIMVANKGGNPPTLDEIQSVIELTTAIINSNLGMIQAGQLSLARTLTPSLAAAHNKTLFNFQALLKSLMADTIAQQQHGQSGGSPDKPAPPKPEPPKPPTPKPPLPDTLDEITADRTRRYFAWGLSQTGLQQD